SGHRTPRLGSGSSSGIRCDDGRGSAEAAGPAHVLGAASVLRGDEAGSGGARASAELGRDRVGAGPVSGGVCTTPPEVAEGGMQVSVHWLRAVTWEPVDVLLGKLSAALNESVVVREGGYHAYSETYQLGAVKLWHNPDRPDMGSCIEVTGEACEELGREGLLAIWDAAEWRASRVDLAADHCPFTPSQVRDAWIAGDVDTRVKSLDPGGKRKPAPGREGWRRCEWVQQPDGDL